MVRFKVARKQIDIAPARRVEGVVEHVADVVLGIIDDPAGLLVPEHRDGDAPVVVRVGGAISLAQKLKSIDRIGAEPRSIAKSPTALIADRVHHRDADGCLQVLQVAHNQRAARPRTS